MTTDLYMAQRLAAGTLEQSDLQSTVIYPSNFKTLPVEIGGTDCINESKDGMGWQDVPASPITSWLICRALTWCCKKITARLIPMLETAEYIISSGGGYVTNEPGVPAPTSFYVTHQPNGIQLSWTNPPARLYEYTELYRGTVNDFSSATLINLSRINQYIDQPPQNALYYYWSRSQNYAGEVSSPAPDVNSGATGVWAGGDQTMVFDPGFEQSPIGDGENSFWAGIGSLELLNSSGRAYASVVSDSLGHW